MKYLKRFNEELKPTTYSSAARKLKKLGHIDRSLELINWAEQIENRENLLKWKDNIDKYSQFGTFKLTIKNKQLSKITGDFHLAVIFDADSFVDNYEYEREESPLPFKSSIWLPIGIIPANEETLNNCLKVLPDTDMGNGFFWGMSITIGIKIDSYKVEFASFEILDYDENVSGNISFSDRQSAGKFKNLLKNIFSDPDLNYPSSRSDVPYLYQGMELTILAECGLSSDYGFSLEKIAQFINTISPNIMYKSI